VAVKTGSNRTFTTQVRTGKRAYPSESSKNVCSHTIRTDTHWSVRRSLGAPLGAGMSRAGQWQSVENRQPEQEGLNIDRVDDDSVRPAAARQVLVPVGVVEAPVAEPAGLVAHPGRELLQALSENLA
jgi:hypothetical protein